MTLEYVNSGACATSPTAERYTEYVGEYYQREDPACPQRAEARQRVRVTTYPFQGGYSSGKTKSSKCSRAKQKEEVMILLKRFRHILPATLLPGHLRNRKYTRRYQLWGVMM